MGDTTTSFNCRRCGDCCKKIGIPWSELDPRLAADYLNVNIGDFVDLYGFVKNESTGEFEHTEYNAAPCPFLKYDLENAFCIIYPVRPWICEGYPGPGSSCIGGEKRS